MQNLRYFALLACCLAVSCHWMGEREHSQSQDGQSVRGVIKAGSAFQLNGQHQSFALRDYALHCTAFGLPPELIATDLAESGAFTISTHPGKPFTCDLRHKTSGQIFALVAAEQTYVGIGADGTTALTTSVVQDIGDVAIGTEGVLLIEKTRLDPAQELEPNQAAIDELLAMNNRVYTLECGEVTPELMAACEVALKNKGLPERVWIGADAQNIGELTTYRLQMRHTRAEGTPLLEGELKSGGSDWSLLKIHSQSYQDGCVIHRWRDLAFVPHPIAVSAVIGVGEIHENCGSKQQNITRFNVRLVPQTP